MYEAFFVSSLQWVNNSNKIIIIQMKRSSFLLFVISLILVTPLSAFQNQDSLSTTIILVRHAEKEGTGRDPVLSKMGMKRAENLSRKLAEYSLAEIYSTPFKRTMNTAKPTADAFDLEINEYMPREEMSDFIQGIIEENRGKAVLIVGHSNTTPGLVNLLMGEKRLDDLEEDQYGDLFIISLSELGEGKLILGSF